MRLRSALVATGAAVLLGMVSPMNAHAATGTFHYTHAYTALNVKITNPADNVCHAATSKSPTGGLVDNRTNNEATLYSLPGCTGEPLGTLSPGQSTPNVEAFGSVRFTPVTP